MHLIISDPGVFMIAKEICPEIEIHISTQANNTNYGTYQFWYAKGAKRVCVCKRAFPLVEIKEIRDNIPKDLEIKKPLSMEQCVFLFGQMPAQQLFLPDEMPIRVPAPIHAVGNMQL